MLRKLAVAPILLAMMMVAVATVLPHHHHETMICIAHEICGMDGCRDDEHTHHSDANHDEDESHCVAHEHYFPSENLRITPPAGSDVITGITAELQTLAATLNFIAEETASEYAFGDLIPLIVQPPLISQAAPNAPPSAA